MMRRNGVGEEGEVGEEWVWKRSGSERRNGSESESGSRSGNMPWRFRSDPWQGGVAGGRGDLWRQSGTLRADSPGCP